MIVDTHFHLYDEAFLADRDEVVERAKDTGIYKCIMPAIDSTCWKALIDTAGKYKDFCNITAGLHPTSVTGEYKGELKFAQDCLEQTLGTDMPPVAIGEIGLDCYWSREFEKEQTICFLEQLEWAKQCDLPVIIHARDSFDLLLKCLKEAKSSNLRGVLHAFSGSLETFTEANRYGCFKMGIGGVLTFKNSKLAELVKQVDIKELLFETDAPYLTPVPFRGKRNETSYLKYISAKLCEVLCLEKEYLETIIYKNTLELFNIK